MKRILDHIRSRLLSGIEEPLPGLGHQVLLAQRIYPNNRFGYGDISRSKMASCTPTHRSNIASSSSAQQPAQVPHPKVIE